MLRLIEYGLVRLLMAALQCLSYSLSVRLSRVLAGLAFRFDATPRARAIGHLKLAYGAALADGQAEKIALGVFQTISRHVVEIAHVVRQASSRLRVENPEILTQAHARGRGVVVVSAHMGCWIRMAVIPRLLGLPVAIIMKKQRNDALLRWGIRFLKRHFDLDVIRKAEAREQAVRFLEEGKVVAFFADQHPRRGGFPARFFGRDVLAAGGPAVYAKRFGCPLVVFTASEHPDGGHVLRFDGPVSIEGTCDEVSQRWLDLLEARIREHPEQWMWMHRRWRAEAA